MPKWYSLCVRDHLGSLWPWQHFRGYIFTWINYSCTVSPVEWHIPAFLKHWAFIPLFPHLFSLTKCSHYGLYKRNKRERYIERGGKRKKRKKRERERKKKGALVTTFVEISMESQGDVVLPDLRSHLSLLVFYRIAASKDFLLRIVYIAHGLPRPIKQFNIHL